MSEALVKEWKERVEEVETELRLVNRDIEVMKKSQKKIEEKLADHFQKVDEEKIQLLEELDKAGKEAQLLQQSCEDALTHKERVEKEYQKVLDDYEKLHFEVREIKEMEEDHLHSRVNYKTLLEKESLLWGNEEHFLRQQLGTLHREYEHTKKKNAEERATLELEIQEKEKELEEDRNTRTTLLKPLD